jgi:hypothetical protein
MANQPQQAPVIDPDNVLETLCDGQFNILVTGQLATLTFTHWRPDAARLFGGAVNNSAVVRARIVLTLQSLVGLKDFLNRFVQTAETAGSATPATGGATQH